MNLTQAYNEQVDQVSKLRRELAEARALIERMCKGDTTYWFNDAALFLKRTEQR